ncbi:hypothetical protein A4H34_03495 [Peptidiphaga gingivicola]|uniref:Uncharacterized protein n=1 Tax=Peptidiphaga gingivicola TaxID=2741497 RepID=A0A179B3H0_9ACTO|nr:hypothetical protein A4H34_03495 [Peptidiphaga gingivicola]
MDTSSSRPACVAAGRGRPAGAKAPGDIDFPDDADRAAMDEETWSALDAGVSAAIDVEIVDADRASASPAPNIVLRRLGRRFECEIEPWSERGFKPEPRFERGPGPRFERGPEPRFGRRPCVKRVARLFFIVFLSDVPVGPFADILGAVARGKPTIG